jgi:hypothetical protein
MEEEKDSVYIKNIFKEVEELKEVEEHPISKMLLLELKYYTSNQHDTPQIGFKDSHAFFRSTKEQ